MVSTVKISSFDIQFYDYQNTSLQSTSTQIENIAMNSWFNYNTRFMSLKHNDYKLTQTRNLKSNTGIDREIDREITKTYSNWID